MLAEVSSTVNNAKALGLRLAECYAACRKMQILRYLCATCLIMMACTSGTHAPEDEDLVLFIETFSECARVYRVYSDREEMLADELGQVDFPEDWTALVDSLTAVYGGDLDFWIETFTEISNRSRR